MLVFVHNYHVLNDFYKSMSESLDPSTGNVYTEPEQNRSELGTVHGTFLPKQFHLETIIITVVMNCFTMFSLPFLSGSKTLRFFLSLFFPLLFPTELTKETYLIIKIGYCILYTFFNKKYNHNIMVDIVSVHNKPSIFLLFQSCNTRVRSGHFSNAVTF